MSTVWIINKDTKQKMVKTRNQNRENIAKCNEWEKNEKERQHRIRLENAERRTEERRRRDEKKRRPIPIKRNTSWEDYKLKIHQNIMKIFNEQDM